MIKRLKEIFFSSARFVYQRINKPDNVILHIYQKISKKNAFFQKEQVIKDLHTLEPAKSIEAVTEEYYVKKISIILGIMVGGIVLTAVLFLSEQCNNPIIDGKYIERYAYGEGDRVLALEAEIGEKQKEAVEVLIAEQKYSDEELDVYADKLCLSLEEIILGENETVDDIHKNMKLVSYVEGYPFHLKYAFDNTDYIDNSGRLLEAPEEEDLQVIEDWNKNLQKGVLVTITVNLSYQDYKKEFEMPVMIREREKSQQEKIREQLNLLLKRTDFETQTTKQLELPQQIEGEPVIWNKKKEAVVPICLAILLAVIVVLYVSKDKDLHDIVVRREAQMLLDYPEIVSKITLLTGAGLTVRNSFYRMAKEYRNKRQGGYDKHYAYEEILFAVYEMESGVSEIQAYENFGKRCRIQQYIKLSALLVQNLKKSSSGLFTILQEEANDSFDLRKSMAKKLGEEAGTKMLLPLILMLGIVMIIIFYPAMASFAS